MKLFSLLILLGLVLLSILLIATAAPIDKGGIWEPIYELQNKVADLQSQIDNIQLIPGPQGPQGEQGPPGTSNVVIVKGYALNGNWIYPPTGFYTYECDIIVRPEVIQLQYHYGGVNYVAYSSAFGADDEMVLWRIYSVVYYTAEDDPAQSYWLYPGVKYTIICPCSSS